MKGKAKGVVIVLEGLAPSVVEKGIASGALPHFERLRRQGAHGPLTSEFVPYETAGLLTAFSGSPIAHHGWHSYWKVHNPDYVPVVRTSRDPRPDFLWERPDLSDLQCTVINICGTHPPQPLNGHLISYPMKKSLRACYPAGLLADLNRQGIRYIHDVLVWYEGQARGEFLDNALKADRARAQALFRLFKESDLAVLNLTAIDRTSHYYWQEIEPGSPIAFQESAVFQAYAQCDAVLGKLLDSMDDSTNLLVFSEFGFGGLKAYCSINQHLESSGLLNWNGQGNGAVDWERSIAFESVQGSNGVNVNLKGRYRSGTVSSRDYERTCLKVAECLKEAINPHTGLPYFKNVMPREEVYPGRALEEAPDLALEPSDERYLPLGDNYWADHVNRTLQSGWHRRNSWWFGAGPAFKAGMRQSPARLIDLAPTCYQMLGRGVPAEFQGGPLG